MELQFRPIQVSIRRALESSESACKLEPTVDQVLHPRCHATLRPGHQHARAFQVGIYASTEALDAVLWGGAVEGGGLQAKRDRAHICTVSYAWTTPGLRRDE
jgi:hypothetical protein